jgi:hypothetical protein
MNTCSTIATNGATALLVSNYLVHVRHTFIHVIGHDEANIEVVYVHIVYRISYALAF